VATDFPERPQTNKNEDISQSDQKGEVIMRRTLITVALFCAPLAATGQNVADTVQVGENNEQLTVQSGNNFAVTRQYGSDNRASISQTGHRNVAAVAQVGEGHEQTVVQTGDNSGYGSVQVTNKVFTGTYSGVGGNAFTSTTLVFEGVQ